MKLLKILEISIKNLFKKPYTNLFPEIPPISVPNDYRGMIGINNDLCNGCKLCCKACPCEAIQIIKKVDKARIGVGRCVFRGKARIWVGRCVFCGQCVDACPKNAIFMTNDVLINAYEKDSRRLIVE